MYTSTLNGTIAICRTEGLGGIYRGLGPTVGPASRVHGYQMRLRWSDHEAGRQQCCAIRLLFDFATVHTEHVEASLGETVFLYNLCCGSHCGFDHRLCVTPYLSFKRMVGADHSDSTMPLDNIKTRMQAAGAESKYRNSFDCLMKVGELQHYSQRKVG